MLPAFLTDEEEEERKSEDSDSGTEERDSYRRDITLNTTAGVAMETDNIGALPAGFRILNFDWLTSQHFSSEGQTQQPSN